MTEAPRDEIRERLAKTMHTEGAWCGDCEFEGWDSCSECRRVCLTYADAVLGVLDHPTLLALLGAERAEGYHDVACPLFVWEHVPDLFDDEPDCTCSSVYRFTAQENE